MNNLKILIPIIAIISVAVMLIWGFISGSWQYCWLSVFVGGCLIAIVSIISGSKNKK